MKDKLIEALRDWASENGSSELCYLKNEKMGDFIISTEKVHGGGEGDGEKHWIVLKVEDGERVSFWKIPGWYQSYSGAELEIGNIFEVFAKEISVTVWEKK